MNAATLKANTRLAQEAWDHLRGTGVRSYDPLSDSCCYTGTGCAFSPALKKRAFEAIESIDHPVSDSMTARYFIEGESELLKKWARHCSVKFAQAVQMAHDKARNGDFLTGFAIKLNEECIRAGVPVPTGLVEYLKQQS